MKFPVVTNLRLRTPASSLSLFLKETFRAPLVFRPIRRRDALEHPGRGVGVQGGRGHDVLPGAPLLVRGHGCGWRLCLLWHAFSLPQRSLRCARFALRSFSGWRDQPSPARPASGRQGIRRTSHGPPGTTALAQKLLHPEARREHPLLSRPPRTRWVSWHGAGRTRSLGPPATAANLRDSLL